MHGDIFVASKPDYGSTFTLRLPFALVAEQNDMGTATPTVSSANAAPVAPRPADVAGLTCLVVGNEAQMAEDIAAYLAAGAAQVNRVPDLDAARQWMHTHSPGLTVWVLDAGEDPPGSEQLLAAIGPRDQPHTRMVVVVIGRATLRRPNAATEGFVMLDGNALNRQTLTRTVAAAAGRVVESTEVAAPKRRIPAKTPPSREEALRQGRLILVAEDNEINQKVVRQQLGQLGFAMDVVGNGREAMQALQHDRYALLLTDLHMPDMDGYDLALGIRAREAGQSRLPIVALTANALAGEAERCRAVGMDDYLSKPATLAQLTTMLERWLPPSPPQLAQAPLDVNVLEALVGTDPHIVREFLQAFASGVPGMAAAIVAALTANEAQSAAASAHKLKSSAHAVGALQLGDICAAIEAAGKAGEFTLFPGLLEQFRAELALVHEFLRATLPDAMPAAGFG
jgi:CheY-like chemotaxis protein/HPt (histidine-containing phosphotransfer) domain-containing protein